MVATDDMFGSTQPSSVSSKSIRWMFVTNHLNLHYMLASGLLMPPKGFGEKYYQDTLAAFPGWIPLFANTVFKSSVDYSITEKSHLIPCIASLDLSNLQGKVIVIKLDGSSKEVIFPHELDGDEQILLIPAPLPIHWISSISYQSKEHKISCESDIRSFKNVPLLNFERKIDGSSLSSNLSSLWPPKADIPSIDVEIGTPLAAGAIMAMLTRLANLDDLGVQACRLAFDKEADITKTISDPIVSSLGKWISTGQQIESEDISNKLFWGVVTRIADSRFIAGSENSADVVLNYLKTAAEDMEPRMKQAINKLAEDLRTIAVFSDKTITEIFERHPKSFSRVMTLFFLRSKCEELLIFKHSLLTNADLILASILFAARDSWLGLSLKLRNSPETQAAIQHRMAVLSHSSGKTGIILGHPPARPIPLRELFFQGPKGWNAVQKSAALSLSKDMKWEGLLTRISLAKGEYQVVIDGGGMHIILLGEAKAVTTEVDTVKFFSELALSELSEKQEKKIREQLIK